MKKLLAMVVVLALGACTGPWQLPVAGMQGCPAEAVQQAQWVHNNLPRVQLGGSRQQAIAVVGLPAKVESFLLSDNSAIDVFYYHTPETACRSGGAGLLPLVFQNDKLLGYGQNYYHSVVVPNLRQPLGMPLARQLPNVAPSTDATLGRGQPLR
ncbi:MAG: hypothetical protein H6922_00170 [Pseudomonadaceae bacterium]|nr:hypothetical protein [Pseudomonadaceae bacterium]